jgi:hypothetical protein
VVAAVAAAAGPGELTTLIDRLHRATGIDRPSIDHRPGRRSVLPSLDGMAESQPDRLDDRVDQFDRVAAQDERASELARRRGASLELLISELSAPLPGAGRPAAAGLANRPRA